MINEKLGFPIIDEDKLKEQLEKINSSKIFELDDV